MTHTPSHLPPEDPRLRDQIGGGWSENFGSGPGPTLDEETALIIETAIYGDGGYGSIGDPVERLMEQYPGLEGWEAAEYAAAYQRSRDIEIAGQGTRGYTIPAQRSVSGNPNVFAKLPTYTTPYTGVYGSNRETETDLIWTEEGGFQRLALREREGPAAAHAQKKYEESPAGRKEAVKGAGGAIVYRKGKFSGQRHRGIGRSALRV